jgi:hypothetical protein
MLFNFYFCLVFVAVALLSFEGTEQIVVTQHNVPLSPLA